MPSFLSLPNELLASIIAELPFRDIRSLSLTSKEIRAVAIPALFHTIRMKWDYAQRFTIFERPLLLLLRTLSETPSLARHVRIINIMKDGQTYTPPEKVFSRSTSLSQWSSGENGVLVPGGVYSLCNDALTRSGVPDAEEWVEEFVVEGVPDAMFALLVLLCKNLTTLNGLKIPGCRFLSLLRYTLTTTNPTHNSMGQDQDTFAKLTRLSFVFPRYWRQQADFDDLIELDENQLLQSDTNVFLLPLYLPNLKDLEMGYMPSETPDHSGTFLSATWPLPHPPPGSKLEKLVLPHCCAEPSTLALLLSQTHKLKELDYTILLSPDETVFDCEALQRALDHVRPSLRTLSIHFSGYDSDISDIAEVEDVVSGNLSFLASFNNLTSLEAPLGLLFGQGEPNASPLVNLASTVPLSLERLTINDDLSDYDQFVNWHLAEHLFRSFIAGEKQVECDASHQGHRCWKREEGTVLGWRTRPSPLKEFIVKSWWWAYCAYVDEKMWYDFVGVCEEQGVRCIILQERPRRLDEEEEEEEEED